MALAYAIEYFGRFAAQWYTPGVTTEHEPPGVVLDLKQTMTGVYYGSRVLVRLPRLDSAICTVLVAAVLGDRHHDAVRRSEVKDRLVVERLATDRSCKPNDDNCARSYRYHFGDLDD